MNYSQEQLQQILNGSYSSAGSAPNQDDNGCPYANQTCCPSCGGGASACPPCQPTPVTPTVPAYPGYPGGRPVYPTYPLPQWPFFPGFPGGCYPPAPPTHIPPMNTWPDGSTPPNQDDNGCPYANQTCCPSCGGGSGSCPPCPTTGSSSTSSVTGAYGTGGLTTNGSGLWYQAQANGTLVPLSQNPLYFGALSPTVFPSDIAPSMDENGCPLINGCSLYSC